MAAWDCEQNEESCVSWTRVRTRITEQRITTDIYDTEQGVKYASILLEQVFYQH